MDMVPVMGKVDSLADIRSIYWTAVALLETLYSVTYQYVDPICLCQEFNPNES